MATIIDMPKLSDTMEEGTIARWNIKEGDTVNAGDIVAEVETDKATMDLEAFDGGTVLKILVQEGDAVPLGAPLAVLGEQGEDISSVLDEAGASGADEGGAKKDDAPASEEAESSSEGAAEQASDNTSEESGEQGRVKASPLARKIAQERGIDLSKVKGTGPQGRVVKGDLDNYKDSGKPAAQPAAAEPARTEQPAAEVPLPAPSFTGSRQREDEDIKLSQMRKTIARRLAESKFTSPHFYETVDIDMKAAIRVREGLNAVSDVKISFNDLVVKACATALRRHPWINASWKGDIIRKHGEVNVAVAVAVDEGLLTPVIRHTDQKGLRDISIETKDFARRARDKKLQPEDWEGSTFTVSNLGMYGIEEFTAIINPPNAAILAVGAIRDVPVVENGAVVPGKRMKVTLSSDHRIVDGAKAAEFLSTVRSLLEEPATMLL